MFADSITSSLKSQLFGNRDRGAEDFCKFWTRLDGLVCVQHVQVAKNVIYRPHSHSEYGIVICLQGEVSKAQLGTITVIGPGEVVISNSGIEHASGYLAGPKGCEAVCLTIEPRGLTDILGPFHLPAINQGLGPVFTGKFSSAVLHDCAIDIARELRSCDIGHEIIVEGLAKRILVGTMRAWPRQQVDRCDLDRTPRLPRRDFIRAYEFMRWCRKDSFRLQNLCQFLGTSEERFARLFQTATQHTPASFYNQLLMERSCELLRDGGIAVKAISYELGFKTSSHFTVCFKRQFRITPQEYRQNYYKGLE
jgi:AraC-like DNA-binding protein